MCSLRDPSELNMEQLVAQYIDALTQEQVAYERMCSLAIECVLLLYTVFSCYRMCSLAIECVLVL